MTEPEPNRLRRDEVEQEVRRLAPWYYLFDFDGVRTDIAPPCDAVGFRSVRSPEFWPGFWKGKRVLDVACNEGAYAFGALSHGAARVDAFDCRAVNIEKARFAARMFGHANITLHVATTDQWLAAHHECYDVVLLCGILYHLPEPERTIAGFSDRAGEWIFVTSLVQGLDGDGWVVHPEIENVAASAGALPSRVPASSRTLIRQFAEQGFRVAYMEEVCSAIPGGTGGACSLVLRNCRQLPPALTPDATSMVDVHLAPCSDELFVTMYSRADRSLHARAELSLTDRGGRRTLASEQLELRPRVRTLGKPASRAAVRRIPMDWSSLAPGAELQVELRDSATGGWLGSCRQPTFPA